MSVANIAFMEDRILCLTDTLQYRDRMPVGLTSRKCDLPDSSRYALVTRGLVWAGDRATDFACQGEDFDEAERLLSMYFEGVFLPLSKKDPNLSVEGTVLGWSDLHQSLRGVQFLINKRPKLEVKVLGQGWHISPKHPRFPLPPTVRPDLDAARMVKVALAQQKALNGLHDFNECIGGVMHLTTITRAGAVQEIVGLYPDYREHADAFGDPIANDVSAYLGALRAAA